MMDKHEILWMGSSADRLTFDKVYFTLEGCCKDGPVYMELHGYATVDVASAIKRAVEIGCSAVAMPGSTIVTVDDKIAADAAGIELYRMIEASVPSGRHVMSRTTGKTTVVYSNQVLGWKKIVEVISRVDKNLIITSYVEEDLVI